MKKALEMVMGWVQLLLSDCCNLDAKYVTISGGGDWASMTSIIGKIYDYIAILGIGLTIAYFLMEVNEKLAFEGRDLTMKSFFAPFLKFVAAIAVISQSGKIVSWIISFNDIFITTISGYIKNDTESMKNLADAFAALEKVIGDFAFFVLFVVLFIMILIAIIGFVLKLVWWYKGMLYKLELLFRLAFLPAAVADVYSGRHSSAIRYFKGFLALGFYGVSLVALPAVALNLSTAMMTDQIAKLTAGGADFVTIISSILMFIIAPFAAIAASNIVKQISREALGA